MVRGLNLGCGNNKKDNEFGIDICKESKADFIFDLNKNIPKKFYNKFDVVKSEMVLDHMGNPLIFLESCYLCLKKEGVLNLIIDNGDYWRYHFGFGCYHATLLSVDNYTDERDHKMMFQLEHIKRLLRLCKFKDIKAEYFRDYKFPRGHVDYLLPEHLGKNMIRISCKK